MTTIAASILSADRRRLDDEVRRVIDAGVDAIHINVIDADDRPNLTLAHSVCTSLRPHCAVPIGVHLRVPAADTLIETFAEAGADLISVHPGADTEATLQRIRRAGCRAGLAFDPAQPLDALPALIGLVDMVHVSCAWPTTGARRFVESSLGRIGRARRLIDAGDRDIRLQVDGDIRTDNIGRVARAGADGFVVGRAIFGSRDYRAAVAALRAEVDAVARQPAS